MVKGIVLLLLLLLLLLRLLLQSLLEVVKDFERHECRLWDMDCGLTWIPLVETGYGSSMIQRAVLCLVNGQQIDQKMMQEPSQLLGKGIEGRGL
jgi:hypothetical protein